MRNLIIALSAAFVYFHSPDGGLVAFYSGDGQVIIRPAPPGYNGKTQILTGAGDIVVSETPCQVAHALARSCPLKNAPIIVVPPAVPAIIVLPPAPPPPPPRGPTR